MGLKAGSSVDHTEPDRFSHSQSAPSNKATINPEATNTAVVVFVFGYPVLMWE